MKRHGAAAGVDSVPAFHNFLRSDAFLGLGAPIRETRSKTKVEHKSENNIVNIRYETPHGVMTARNMFDEPSCSYHPVEFPVKSREDILLMTSVYEDSQVSFDEEANNRAGERRKALGESASTMVGVGESPLMEFVEWLAGVENAHYLIADYPDETQALFAAMHRVLKRRIEIIADKSPADAFLLSENTSTTLISPEQYREYCKPVLKEYADIMRSADRILILHMCGYIKGLLPDIAEVGAAAFEAFTSPPVGNTALIDGRSVCPDVCIIGGTNAAFWMRDDPTVIISQLEKDLAALPHLRGIVVSSAGVMPSSCSPETIRKVCDWVRSVPC